MAMSICPTMTRPFGRVFRDSARQAALEREGFVVLDFLDQEEVGRLSNLWESLDDEVKSLPFSATIMSPDLSYRRRVSDEIGGIFTARLTSILHDYRFCHGSFIAKLPGRDEGRVALHQDQSFVDEERFTPAVLWVPLVDVTRTTGCLRVVRGSHRINRGPRGSYRDFPYPELQPVIESRFLTDVPMRAGQLCVMTATLFHQSETHRGDSVRVAIGALSIPEESRLLYYYQDPETRSARMERFEVPDDFYLRHTFGLRPDDIEGAGFVDARTEPLTLAQLEAACRPAPAGS